MTKRTNTKADLNSAPDDKPEKEENKQVKKLTELKEG